jgi:hypothetical protein
LIELKTGRTRVEMKMCPVKTVKIDSFRGGMADKELLFIFLLFATVFQGLCGLPTLAMLLDWDTARQNITCTTASMDRPWDQSRLQQILFILTCIGSDSDIILVLQRFADAVWTVADASAAKITERARLGSEPP